MGLYLAPPDRALVLCVDEKSQIHALPNLPVAALRPDQRSAAPTATPATVRPAEKNVPEALDVPLILDIYGTHKTKLLRDWLAKRPRFHGRFTPTSAFWLNLVRHWFALLIETETPGLTKFSQAFAVRKEQQISSGNYKKQRNSRFPSGMTTRKLRATARTTATTGVLRFAQDDGGETAKDDSDSLV